MALSLPPPKPGFIQEPTELTPEIYAFIKELQVAGSYRLVFRVAYGRFPHTCCFCGREVDGHTQPYDSTAADIHHIDGDHTNRAPFNLNAAHKGCHSTHNLTYHWSDPENRLKQGEASRNRKPSSVT